MSQWSLIFERQGRHALLLAGLLVGMVVAGSFEAARAGMLWGVDTPVWYWLAVGLAVGQGHGNDGFRLGTEAVQMLGQLVGLLV